MATKDQPIEVTYINNLPSGGGGNRGSNILEVDTCAHGPNYYGDSKRIVTHLHGAHVASRFDGQPEYTILPGEMDVYENGLCEMGDLENFANCPEDCAGKQKGSASKIFSCGHDDGQVDNPIGCGVDADDDRCIDSSANLFCREMVRVPACCGDMLCEGAETEASCAIDCAPAPPPPPVCEETEPTEVSCFDTLDNDCNEATDCSDANCDDANDGTTSCGVGICAATGNLTCSGGGEVDTCTPGTPGVEGPFGDSSCSDGLDNDCDGDTDDQDSDCQQQAQCSDFGDRQTCRDNGCSWKKNTCQN